MSATAPATQTPPDVTDAAVGDWTTAGPGGTSLLWQRMRLTSGANAGAVAIAIGHQQAHSLGYGLVGPLIAEETFGRVLPLHHMLGLVPSLRVFLRCGSSRMPSASDASRTASGTSRRISSVERITIGKMITASARDPAMALEPVM